MPDTTFDNCTPRFSLPLLFVGQTQKEGFVNEVTSRIDALLFLAIEGEADAPPANPAEGESWLVGATAQGDWSGQAGQIASRQGGNWVFTAPTPGMRLFDKARNQDRYFREKWSNAPRIASPSGGTTIDSESRSAINAIIAALAAAGIVPAA